MTNEQIKMIEIRLTPDNYNLLLYLMRYWTGKLKYSRGIGDVLQLANEIERTKVIIEQDD